MTQIDGLAIDEESVRNWCRNLLNDPSRIGGFLTSLCEAALKADGFNFRILQPSIEKLMEKYPEYQKKEIIK